ncbi:alpha/beta-hydrolase [Fomitiporia mediterranea MF3/22]|uniref:alpha/beta-hydrolase n=1 Tax=Fomitiporia mediterranea (strain MF3/22) TaxID=694068 RepID=UPI0004407851|nr:alpha/beta-hydrolase [Fomitiporia mediterranea MF3/22]EJD05720.1 alpha/beta-hydrolase [Fomitiporia mediterranea MF3/22]
MADELNENEYKTIFDPTTLVKKGLCPVTHFRGQDNDPFESHSLYYEIHGEGPEKVVFIMGLNSTSFSWEPQVEHFGRSGKYSVLVFDNRGVGNSGTPRGPYTTSGMAEDAIVLLEFIGWTKKRDLHVVGTSLGGMIAMELSSRIPERIVSLTLTVTTAGGRPWSNLPSWKGLSSLVRLLTISDPLQKVPIALDMLFPKEFLDAKADGDRQGRTNREIQEQKYYRRIAATRIQSPIGAISQMSAGLTHRVTPDRLRRISASIPKVLIVTGDADHLVDPRNSKYLKDNMPEAEYQVFEHTGHAIHFQWPIRYNELLERVMKEGRERAKAEHSGQS